jgi:membrane protease YdiL (CAAX protease family)
MLLWRLPETFEIGDVEAARAAYGQVGLIFGFGPLIAALIASFGFSGVAGLRELLGRITVLRFSPFWYIAALILPAAAQWLGTLAWSSQGRESLSIPSIGVVSAVTLLVAHSAFAVGEELGWRGFMLPRVLRQHGWLASGLIVGFLWAVWHYPPWIAVNYAVTGSIWKTAAIVGLASTTGVAFSLMITLLFTRTRGSLVPALLFHGAANANMNLIYEGLSQGALSSVSLLLATTVAAAALSILVVIAAHRRTREGPRRRLVPVA